MRRTIGIGLVFLSLVFHATGQNDTTLELRVFSLSDIRITPDESYKKSTLDSQLLASNALVDLGELLRRESELFIRDQGPGMLSTASMRGTGAGHTKLYFNGVPIHSGMNGTFDLTLLSGLLVDDLEVHYGASSMIDGDGGLGGSLQLKQKATFEPHFYATVLGQIGSFKSHNEALRVDWSDSLISSSTRVLYQYSGNDFPYIDPTPPEYQEYVREQAQFSRGGFSHLLALKTGKQSVLKPTFIYLSADRDLPGPAAAAHPVEKQDARIAVGTVEWNKTTSKASWYAIGGFKHHVLQYENQGADVHSKNEENHANGQFRVHYYLGQKVKMESSIIGDYAQAFNPEYGQWKSQWRGQMIHRGTWSWANKKWFNSLLIKTQWVDDRVYPVLPSYATRYPLWKKWMVARLTASYHVAAPTLNDRYWGVGGNPDVKDERGYTMDAGIRGQSGKKWKWNYDIGYYLNQVDDWILWVPGSDGIWRVTNRDHVLAQGIEANLGIKTEWNGIQWSARTMYNYQYTETDEGRQLIYTPQHRARINVEGQWKSWYLSYDHSYTGTRYINPENSAWMPDYFLADLRLGWRKRVYTRHRIGLEAGVLNLFDEPYQNLANRPMPGRNFFLKMRYEWL